ncbi:MAG TPA: DNA primase [Spirochaetia bacterium]|nr:DNA primase [Spirochaetia bacterium]
MRIPESTLSEIQNRLDIAEVIGEYVPLQRKGGRYWGLCPFHQEKSPSFTVTPDKGVFYCFGCHKGGGLFQFVMEVEKLAWRDAVELLAKKAGVEIPRGEGSEEGARREAFLELHKRVAGSFHWLLCEGPQAEAARKYLTSRGVSREIIDSFQLGFAPPEREWLHRFLLSKSYSADFLAQTGLFLRGEKGNAGLFVNRIMFPIGNPRGETLAFGGRALGEAQPKYMNSPETAFFRKGENLFGLDKAAAPIRSAGQFVLVEGYMDVLAMHQAGVSTSVAPLGTALTESQVRLLKRYAQKGVLVFDGDEAGQKATMRAIEMLERQDLIAQVVELPDGKDPADFVQNGEIEKLRGLLEKPQESFRYLVAKAIARQEISTPQGREGVRDFLFPFVASVGSQLRADGYLKLIAESLDAEEQAIRGDFAAWRAREKGRTRGRPQGEPDDQRPLSADLFLMLAVAANRELFPLVRNGGISISELDDDRARTLFVALEESFRAEETGLDALCARIESAALKDLVVRKAASGEFDLNQEKLVSDGVRKVRQRELRKRIEQLGAEMRRVDRESQDSARMRELLAEKMHLDDELAKLNTGAARA